MKVIFCSNYLNHHQLYFSLAMINNDIEYYFIANEKIEEERHQGGWEDLNQKYDWVVRMYEGGEQLKKAKELICTADLVITGSFPMKYLLKRIFLNKPIFLYSERWYKSNDGDINKFLNLRSYLSNLLHNKYLNYRKVYMLCASAYTSADCAVYNNFKNKCYKWGYFPKVYQYDIDKILEQKDLNKKVKILWCARYLKLKHPEYVVELAKKLKEEKIDVQINMIGIGDEYNKITEEICQYNLDNIHQLGSMSTEAVRDYMIESNIFLFTSDFYEGWGAVMNESMNSGCAVVASHAIGSVPFLINDGENGFIYNYGDFEEFYQITKKLILDRDLCRKIGRNAYFTMVNEWNADNAARKLLMLYDNLINKKELKISSGVCSKAEIMDNFWRKK